MQGQKNLPRDHLIRLTGGAFSNINNKNSKITP